MPKVYFFWLTLGIGSKRGVSCSEHKYSLLHLIFRKNKSINAPHAIDNKWQPNLSNLINTVNISSIAVFFIITMFSF